MISLFFCQQQTNYANYNLLHNETKCESFCLQRLIAQALIWLRSSRIEAGMFLVRFRTVNKHCIKRCSFCFTPIVPPVQFRRASLKVNQAGRRFNSANRDFRIPVNSELYAAFCLFELHAEADCLLCFKDN